MAHFEASAVAPPGLVFSHPASPAKRLQRTAAPDVCTPRNAVRAKHLDDRGEKCKAVA